MEVDLGLLHLPHLLLLGLLHLLHLLLLGLPRRLQRQFLLDHPLQNQLERQRILRAMMIRAALFAAEWRVTVLIAVLGIAAPEGACLWMGFSVESDFWV